MKLVPPLSGIFEVGMKLDEANQDAAVSSDA